VLLSKDDEEEGEEGGEEWSIVGRAASHGRRLRGWRARLLLLLLRMLLLVWRGRDEGEEGAEEEGGEEGGRGRGLRRLRICASGVRWRCCSGGLLTGIRTRAGARV